MRVRIFFVLIAVATALSVKGEAARAGHVGGAAGARTDSIVPLGVCLENYNYAYPVKYISLDIQMGNYPVLGRTTQAKIPNCRLVELPGVGHVPHVEVFDEFIRVLSGFLND